MMISFAVTSKFAGFPFFGFEIFYNPQNISFIETYGKHSKSERCDQITWFLEFKDLLFTVVHSDFC